MLRIGLPDAFPHKYGSQEELFEIYGLTPGANCHPRDQVAQGRRKSGLKERPRLRPGCCTCSSLSAGIPKSAEPPSQR